MANSLKSYADNKCVIDGKTENLQHLVVGVPTSQLQTGESVTEHLDCWVCIEHLNVSPGVQEINKLGKKVVDAAREELGLPALVES